MPDYISDIYNHKEMTREEILEYFQKTTALPDVFFRTEAEIAQDVVYSQLLPLYRDDITDYDSLLKDKVVQAIGFTNNEKHYLKRHVEKHGGIFRFKSNGQENIIILYSGTSLYGMLYALDKARNEGAIIIDVDDFTRNIKEKFSEEEEQRRKEVERNKRSSKSKTDLNYISSSEECIENIPKASLKELSLENDIFHVIGKINYSYWDNNKTHYFNNQNDVYDFILDKGGKYIKKESKDVTCVIYGSDPAKSQINKYIGKVKLIDAVSFLNWLRVHRYNVCAEEDLAHIPKANKDSISLEDDVFHIIGNIDITYWNSEYECENYQSQNSIYNLIKDKGGLFFKEESKEVTCVIYGKEPPKDKIFNYINSVKLIDAFSFLRWIKEQDVINQKCRVFEKKYSPFIDPLLRPYQQDIKQKIFKKWNNCYNVMLQLPTGTGKTVLFTSIINDLNKVANTKILILAHRKELIDQISEHLSYYNIRHGIITSGRVRKKEMNVQVASVQTLTHDNNINLLNELNPDFIIIDEAHHSLADSYTKFWKLCGDCWKLGVTATPYRLNNRSFKSHFDHLIVSERIENFIKEGFLADYTFLTDNPQSSLSLTIKSIKEKSSTGDYKTATLMKELNIAEHIQRLIVCYEQYVKGKKGIVYAINKEHARNICEAYNVIGVNAVYIDSDTPKGERQKIVEQFKNNVIQVMVNVDMFSEAFDCPDVEFIQLARPTWSLSKYLQQVGRGLRPCKNKQSTIILDHSRMFAKFGMPSRDREWKEHFSGDPLTKKMYKQEDENNEAILLYAAKNNDEMMIKIDQQIINTGLRLKKEQEISSLRTYCDDDKESDNEESTRKVLFRIIYGLAAASIALIIVNYFGLFGMVILGIIAGGLISLGSRIH